MSQNSSSSSFLPSSPGKPPASPRAPTAVRLRLGCLAELHFWSQQNRGDAPDFQQPWRNKKLVPVAPLWGEIEAWCCCAILFLKVCICLPLVQPFCTPKSPYQNTCKLAKNVVSGNSSFSSRREGTSSSSQKKSANAGRSSWWQCLGSDCQACLALPCGKKQQKQQT